MDVRYSVYRRSDDKPVMIHGTIPQCAAAMGVTVSTFKSMASRQTRGLEGDRSKYEIVRDEDENEE